MAFDEFQAKDEFKRTPDGRKLWFPWGSMSQGYVITSRNAFRGLRRQRKTWAIAFWFLSIVALVIVEVTEDLTDSGAIVVIVYILFVLLVYVAYGTWVRVGRRGYQQASEDAGSHFVAQDTISRDVSSLQRC